MTDVFAAVDAAIAQADRTLAGETNGRRQAQPERDPLIYDLDWDEDERLDARRAVVDQTRNLPPTLAAAIVAEAWDALEPLQHIPWLGPCSPPRSSESAARHVGIWDVFMPG